MLDGGYAGGAEPLGKLTVHRLFALDCDRSFIFYRRRCGGFSALSAHIDKD
jgi:hypothetical protein